MNENYQGPDYKAKFIIIAEVNITGETQISELQAPVVPIHMDVLVSQRTSAHKSSDYFSRKVQVPPCGETKLYYSLSHLAMTYSSATTPSKLSYKKY